MEPPSARLRMHNEVDTYMYTCTCAHGRSLGLLPSALTPDDYLRMMRHVQSRTRASQIETTNPTHHGQAFVAPRRSAATGADKLDDERLLR